ncbi:MAG: hypothetical protein ISR55_03160 [Bacteroidetes bacterium]|nr:hypothetical protein [Bacteroidota bacterium]
MACVIIGIHGLGNKPPKKQLEHWWKLAMMEGLKTHGFHTKLPNFELVYWADILNERPLSESEKDKNSPYFLKEKYRRASKDFPMESHSRRKKIIDFIGKQINHLFLNEDLSLNYSKLSDAILQTYFRDLDIYFTQNCTLDNASICKAKDLINNSLFQLLEKYKDDEIMLISHSMGSIIAFEVLNFEATHIDINTFITIGSPLGLPVVISKIAAEQKKGGADLTHIRTPATVKKFWYNFSDILDKIALNYQLSDDFYENEQGIKPIDFLVVNNYEMNGKRNPHKSYGYLRTREFSTILNEFIMKNKFSRKKFVFQKSGQFIKQLKDRFFIKGKM